MTNTNKFTIVACIVTALYISADWGSLLNDVTTKGKALLSPDSNTPSSTLDYSTIVSGLKEALEVGSRSAIDSVSKPDGYLKNQLIHIAMPPEL
jgi:hypothetical protein